MTEAPRRRSPTVAFEADRRDSQPPAAPFVQVMLRTLERRATGTLVWSPAAGSGGVRVRFEDGFPCAASGDGAGEDLESTLDALCAAQDGGFAFHDQEDLVTFSAQALFGRIDPYALLTQAYRHPARTSLVNRHVSLGDPRVLQLRRGTNLARYRFTEEERAVADRLQQEPASVPGLAAQRALAARVVRRVVYLLRLTGAVTEIPLRERSGDRPIQGRTGHSAPLPQDDPRETHERPVRPPSRPNSEPTTAPPQSRNPAIRDTLRFNSRVPASSGTRPAVQERPRKASPSGGYSIRQPEHGADRIPLSDRPRQAGAPRLPTPPPSLSPLHRGRWRDLAHRYDRLRREDHFLSLGVPRTASEDRIRAAYRSECERWQPGHLPAELAPLRPFAQAILDHLNAAYDTLRHPRLCQRYRDALVDNDLGRR